MRVPGPTTREAYYEALLGIVGLTLTATAGLLWLVGFIYGLD